MTDIPTDAVTAVDSAYALDFHLAGRPVLAMFIQPVPAVNIYDVRDRTFQYAVFGPSCLRFYRSRMQDLVLIKTYGDPHDPFAPYAELYRRSPKERSTGTGGRKSQDHLGRGT